MKITKVTALKWRQMLSTQEGVEGMLYLRENIPSINGEDATAILFSAGINQGYTKAIDAIVALSDAVDEKKKSEEDLLNRGLD
jgi:hypothetical protein